MSKYKTVTVYYQPSKRHVSDAALGRYINDLFQAGIEAVQIVDRPQSHTDHDHPASVPEEPPYTAVQGNVGSS